MAARVSLYKIGNISVGITPTGKGKKPYRVGALEALIKENIKNKIAKKDLVTLDVLHDIIQNDPKTKTVTEDSIRQLVAPANYFLASMLDILGKTVNSSKSFPGFDFKSNPTTSNKKVALAAGASLRSVTLGLAPIQAPAAASGRWASLSPGYLRSIGFKIKRLKKSPSRSRLIRKGQGKKRFWYERRRTGSKASNKGTSMGKEVAAEMSSIGQLLLAGIPGKILSSGGLANTFSFSEKGKRRRARTHARKSKKGKVTVVWGVTGDLIAPTVLTVSDEIDSEFTNVTLEAMLAGKQRPVGASISSILAREGESGIALMMVNESRRPWISHMFAQAKPLFLKYMHEELSKKARF